MKWEDLVGKDAKINLCRQRIVLVLRAPRMHSGHKREVVAQVQSAVISSAGQLCEQKKSLKCSLGRISDLN